MANIITKLRGTEYNDMNSPIEDSSADMKERTLATKKL